MGTSFEAYPGDFPDPDVIRSGSTYYGYATNAASANVQLVRSDDLHSWTNLGDALPVLPAWATAGKTWAPSVWDRGDAGSVMYYTVSDRASGREAISVATAAGPAGPFVDTSTQPLVFQYEQGGSIDPSVFIDADGTPYLFWKRDDSALNRPSSIWAQPLSPDGLSLLGGPAQMLNLDRPWEEPVLEGPAVLLVNATYYLFYCANWWESANYAIGYAVSSAVLGPYEKVTIDGPWLASTPDAAGPGGPAFFADVAGTEWLAYHAWPPDRVGYGNGGVRSLWLVAVDFTSGSPQLL